MVIFELSRVDYPWKQPKYTQTTNFEKLKKYYVYVFNFFLKMVFLKILLYYLYCICVYYQLPWKRLEYCSWLYLCNFQSKCRAAGPGRVDLTCSNRQLMNCFALGNFDPSWKGNRADWGQFSLILVTRVSSCPRPAADAPFPLQSRHFSRLKFN